DFHVTGVQTCALPICLEQPTSPVYSFDENSIVSATVTDEDQLINSVVINTDVREVQEWQTVYSKKTTDSTLNVIPAFSTYVYQRSEERRVGKEGIARW